MGIKNINARFILWVCSEIPSLQVCNGNHGVWRCDKFKDLGIQERWDTAKRLNLCFRSLGADHRGLTCVRSRICGINSCRETRNRLLHVYKDRNKTLVLSNELIKVKLPPWKIWTVHGGNFTFINSFDKTKVLFWSLPPTQHHSFFRN